jgi:hypothetical protein
MTDRELLELAAKAAGIQFLADRPTEDCLLYVSDEESGNVAEWRPLQDDGDALRLAVKLSIGVSYWDGYYLETQGAPRTDVIRMSYANEAQRAIATRRAIVRAEVGKAMP